MMVYCSKSFCPPFVFMLLKNRDQEDCLPQNYIHVYHWLANLHKQMEIVKYEMTTTAKANVENSYLKFPRFEDTSPELVKFALTTYLCRRGP